MLLCNFLKNNFGGCFLKKNIQKINQPHHVALVEFGVGVRFWVIVEQQAELEAANQFRRYTVKVVAVVFHGRPVASKGGNNGVVRYARTSVLGRRRMRMLHDCQCRITLILFHSFIVFVNILLVLPRVSSPKSLDWIPQNKNSSKILVVPSLTNGIW